MRLRNLIVVVVMSKVALGESFQTIYDIPETSCITQKLTIDQANNI